jgi:hypothetical protein
MGTTAPAPPINLTNSQRRVNKATYAPAQVPPGAPSPPQVMEKAAFAASLAMSPSEAKALQNQAPNSPSFGKTLKLVANLQSTPWPEALRRYGAALAGTSRQDLVRVGEALLLLRQAQATTAPPPAPAIPTPATLAPAVPASAKPAPPAQVAVVGPTQASPAALPTVSAAALLASQTEMTVNTFKYHLPVQPVGALHLERLEMTPVGVEHGELVHSVPMTPGETVNIAHKEWSVTTQTFESIVQDSFEGFSETGIVDKTDLAHAVENETKHSTSLDINGSVTASYSGVAYSVTASLATDYSKKDDARNLVKDSVAHSTAVTRNASARTRKEHRNSFKVSSVAGTEDLAVRTLTNQTPNAVRVDYFQLIRKWRIDLIRYGLRLTYDIVIPNPGIDLIGPVKELQEIEQWLSSASFVFDQAPGAIQPTTDSWAGLQAQYDVALDPPPDPHKTVPLGTTVGPKDKIFDFFGLDVPENYQLSSGSLNADVHGGDNIWLEVAGQLAGIPVGGTSHNQGLSPPLDLGARYGGQTGHIPIPWNGGNFDYVQFYGYFTADVLPEFQAAWRAKTYLALYEAAQARFNQALERAQQRKAFLEDLIGRFDSLTLRKMEHEEVMKWVLRWLLGGFALDSSPVSIYASTPWPESSEPPGEAPAAGAGGSPSPPVPAVIPPAWSMSGIDPAHIDPADINAHRTEVLSFGEFVKFIHNAIEWENCIYLAYPYFWDAVENWPLNSSCFTRIPCTESSSEQVRPG